MSDFVGKVSEKLKKLSDYDDRNAIFLEEVKRASENIIYRLQELEARM